jgi:hypothetical protein
LGPPYLFINTRDSFNRQDAYLQREFFAALSVLDWQGLAWLAVWLIANPAVAQDIISGDEIISDSYDLKEVDGIVYEAECAMIVEGAVQVST